MRIYGIDFTSAPRRSKAITCAVCQLSSDQLTVKEIQEWNAFAGFEAFLQQPGRWTAAMDFPLGQPRRLLAAVGWPEQWEEYVALVGRMKKQEFIELIDQYRAGQPPGDKHHLRCTDSLAGSCSPMMLYGVPVAKMFFEGAPRVRCADVSVVPCRPNGSGRTVIEGYPSLVVRHLVGSMSYKSESRDATTLRGMRCEIVTRCQSSKLRNAYGIYLNVSSTVEGQIIADFKGDALDAVLCAVQAAAYERLSQRRAPIPPTADPVEGWIADPTYGD